MMKYTRFDLFVCFMMGVFVACVVIGALPRLERVFTTMPRNVPILPICYPNGHIQNGWQIVTHPIDIHCSRYVG